MKSSGMTTWAGIDVGGKSKGFDAAVVGTDQLIAGPQRRLMTPKDVIAWLSQHEPAVVGVDSPCCAAPPGSLSRDGERLLASKVCGIRYTPDKAKIDAGGDYYDWIRRGFQLYAALSEVSSWKAIEVFPTASWTRWQGPRGNLSRATWSRNALKTLNLDGLPAGHLSQDGRDAIAAAVTARICSADRVDWFGEIAVPSVGSLDPT
jgi:hypothetical protein